MAKAPTREELEAFANSFNGEYLGQTTQLISNRRADIFGFRTPSGRRSFMDFFRNSGAVGMRILRPADSPLKPDPEDRLITFVGLPVRGTNKVARTSEFKRRSKAGTPT